MLIRLALALWLTAIAPLSAQIAEPDRALALEDAFARLQSAATAEDAQQAEAEVWTLWNIGPDAEATTMLGQATVMLRRGSLNDAHAMLDTLLDTSYVETVSS